mgnify:CR=1 FL=1
MKKVDGYEKVAADSNVLTYLAESMASEYDPATDAHTHVAEQRVASIRLFLYGGNLTAPPTTEEELTQIPDDAARVYQEQIRNILIPELANLDLEARDKRVTELLSHHDDPNDCAILAEAELAGVPYLLTADKQFRSRLSPHSAVVIETPSDHWERLEVPHGSEPRIKPHETNPLAAETWWKW